MTPEQRIHELKTRQVFYGSSMACKLNSINGYWWYSIYAWTQDNTKFLVTMKKYDGEDPEELFKFALMDIGLRRIKLGKPIALLNNTQKGEST